MAKAKDLAGLAALGALGYMLTRDKGEDSNPTRAARPESVETRLERPEDTIKRSMKKSDGESKPITEADVVMPEKEAPRVKPAASLSSRPAKPAAASSVSNADYGNEGRREISPRTYTTKTPGGDAKRTEGNKPMPSLRDVQVRATSNQTDAMRNASRKNVAQANKMKRMAANPEAQAVEESHPEQVLSPGMGVKTIGAAAKALANRTSGAVERSTAPFLKELGNEPLKLGMKRGGAVKPKKMASGGMTSKVSSASKRADGIASRGKTRCKMY